MSTDTNTVRSLKSLADFKPAMPKALHLADVANQAVRVDSIRLQESQQFGPFAIVKMVVLDTGESVEVILSAKLPFEALQAADVAGAFPVTCKFVKVARYWDIVALDNAYTTETSELPF